MDELILRALLGDKRAQQECTRRGIVLPCPKCGKGKIIFWDKKMKWYSCWDCGMKSGPKKSFGEALRDWNTRPAPPVGKCRDCRFCEGMSKNQALHCSLNSFGIEYGLTFITPESFCSYFEPKEESPCPPKSK